jgi:hypothetical protein
MANGALSFLHLDPTDEAKFKGLLDSTYPYRHDLSMLVRRLGKNLNNISNSGRNRQDYDQLVIFANAEGWVAQLIRAVKDDRRGRPDIQAFAAAFHHDVGLPLPDGEPLESVLRLANPILHGELWSRGFDRIRPLVCRVEIDGGERGTGFLVGPKVVMTCHHVVASVIPGGKPAPGARDAVTFRFDFHRTPDGGATPGAPCHLAKRGWLCDHSPHSAADLVPGEHAPPGPDELDYALLRLEAPPGGKERGWLTPEALAVAPRDPLFIVGHPNEALGRSGCRWRPTPSSGSTRTPRGCATAPTRTGGRRARRASPPTGNCSPCTTATTPP